MKRRPLANGESARFQGGWDVIGEAGFEVYDIAHGMKTWPLHGIAGAQALVENTGDDLDERAAKPGAARRARCEH